MDKLLMILTIALIMSSVSLGQKKPDKQLIMEIEQATVVGITSSRFETISKYFSPRFKITTPDGFVLSFKELTDLLKSGDLKLENSVNSEMKIEIYGSTAIVCYQSEDKGSFKGAPITSKNQWTDVLIKLKGNWMLFSAHGTAISTT